MIRQIFLLLATPVILTGVAHAAETSQLQTTLGLSHMEGDISGFLQTPNGGQPGTTSSHRPAFDELGYHHSGMDELSLRWDWKQNSIGVTLNRNEMSGSSVLLNSLTSQNHLFPAGDTISSNIQLDYYLFDYQYRLVDTLWLGKRLTFSPGVDLAMFDFSYQLDDNSGTQANRSYRKISLRGGGVLDMMLTDSFTLQFSAFGTVLPTSNQFGLQTEECSLHYQAWKEENDAVSISVGVTQQNIHYEDNQTVPNHIKADTGPAWKLGVDVSF